MPKRIPREVREARNNSLDTSATTELDWYSEEVAKLDALELPDTERERRKSALFMEFGRRAKKAVNRSNRITTATMFEQRAKDRLAARRGE